MVQYLLVVRHNTPSSGTMGLVLSTQKNMSSYTDLSGFCLETHVMRGP